MRFNGIRKFVEKMFPGCGRSRRASVNRRASGHVSRGFEACEQRVLLTVSMELLKDTNTGYAQGNLTYLSDPSGRIYYVASDDVHGTELWTSDGTVAGTHPVEIMAGAASSDPKMLGMLGGSLIFAAIDPVNGGQVWKTDGTAAGTVKVSDVSDVEFVQSVYSKAAGNKLYFEAHDGVHGYEMWETDGTTAGTHMVFDLAPGHDWSDAQELTDVNGTLFFTAFTVNRGPRKLWKIDPATDQPVLVKDMSATYLTNVNGTLYFASSGDGVHGYELWTSDGSEAGTKLVKDINPAGDSFKMPLTTFGSSLVFLANDGTNGNELWISDGTEGGTVPLTNATPASPFNLAQTVTVSNGAMYFLIDDGVHGNELWTSDGTAAGTKLLKDVISGATGMSSTPLTAMGGWVYFNGNGDLWRTDGTEEGTAVFEAFSTMTPSQHLTSSLVAMGTKVAFGVTDGTTSKTWVSDGTEGGTYSLDVPAFSNAFYGSQRSIFMRYAGVQGSHLWSSDLTASASIDLGGIPYKTAASASSNYRFLGNTFLFPGTKELLKSDGTGAGTTTVMSFASNPVLSNVVGNVMYFIGSDGVHGAELWKTDGTTAGTVMVKDINPGAGNSMTLATSYISGGHLFFFADDGVHGVELWESDGTEAGTVLVQDINPGSASSGGAVLAVAPNGRIFLTANDGSHGVELWQTQGAAGGASLLKDIRSGSSNAGITLVSALGSKILFLADDLVHGNELWVSDGTTAGTVLLNDIKVGTGDGGVEGVTQTTNGIQYFTASDSLHGTELWRTDGTVAGTFLLSDIKPGTASSGVALFGTSGNTWVSFTADDGVHGSELWVSDGTVAGTKLAGDLTAGIAGSKLGGYTYLNGVLYFTVNDDVGANGSAVWSYDPNSGVATLIKNLNPGMGSASSAFLSLLNGKLLVKVTNSVNSSVWISDGTTAGTTELQDLGPQIEFWDSATLGGLNYFVTYDPVLGNRLWRTDGTVGGTLSLARYNIDEEQYVGQFFVFGGGVYFWVAGTSDGRTKDLWRTDGTVAGTALAKGSFDGTPGVFYHLSFSAIVNNGSGTIFVRVDDLRHGSEWWSVKLVPESVGSYRDGKFYLDADGSNGWKVTVNAVTDKSFAFGIAGDLPVSGDWNGDNAKDIGVFRNGTWFLDQNGNYKWNSTAGGDVTFNFGTGEHAGYRRLERRRDH
ncbi:MAG: ELWxxDGT repeat protein [Planctomycetales bacterium]